VNETVATAAVTAAVAVPGAIAAARARARKQRTKQREAVLRRRIRMDWRTINARARLHEQFHQAQAEIRREGQGGARGYGGNQGWR